MTISLMHLERWFSKFPEVHSSARLVESVLFAAGDVDDQLCSIQKNASVLSVTLFFSGFVVFPETAPKNRME